MPLEMTIFYLIKNKATFIIQVFPVFLFKVNVSLSLNVISYCYKSTHRIMQQLLASPVEIFANHYIQTTLKSHNINIRKKEKKVQS